jgi:hypothetical protein
VIVGVGNRAFCGRSREGPHRLDLGRRNVQEILGHRSLEMTLNIYAKMRGQTKRQAVARLRYGHGSKAPAHLVELPEVVPIPVSVTRGGQQKERSASPCQPMAGV